MARIAARPAGGAVGRASGGGGDARSGGGKSMTKIRPQKKNANRHTQRGMGMLEGSIQQDGWIGAITTAADGETFDGSARVEVTANMAMLTVHFAG